MEMARDLSKTSKNWARSSIGYSLSSFLILPPPPPHRIISWVGSFGQSGLNGLPSRPCRGNSAVFTGFATAFFPSVFFSSDLLDPLKIGFLKNPWSKYFTGIGIQGFFGESQLWVVQYTQTEKIPRGEKCTPLVYACVSTKASWLWSIPNILRGKRTGLSQSFLKLLSTHIQGIWFNSSFWPWLLICNSWNMHIYVSIFNWHLVQSPAAQLLSGPTQSSHHVIPIMQSFLCLPISYWPWTLISAKPPLLWFATVLFTWTGWWSFRLLFFNNLLG